MAAYDGFRSGAVISVNDSLSVRLPAAILPAEAMLSDNRRFLIDWTVGDICDASRVTRCGLVFDDSICNFNDRIDRRLFRSWR